MIVEVVSDFDCGTVEPGDRGMITSKGRRVLFRPRVPTSGVVPLYDWVEGDPRWRRVVQGEAEFNEYAEQRSNEFSAAADELRWTQMPDMRLRANRDKLDAQLLAVAARCPGLLLGQICRFFFAPPRPVWPTRKESAAADRVWKHLQASFRRHIDADRMFDSHRVWLTD